MLALLSQRSRAMLRVCQQAASIVQNFERNLLLLVTTELSVRTIKCYSVVFIVTLRLLVIVVSCHQQTLPLTTSDKCHNLPRSGDTVLKTPSRLQRWHNAMKRDIGSEWRFLPTPVAFDAPVRGVLVGISPCRLAWKS